MKKSIKVILAVAAALMVLVCMSGAVLAEETDSSAGEDDPAVEATITPTEGASGTTNVKYSTSQSYLITIPDAVTIDTIKDDGSAPIADKTLSATNVLLTSGNYLHVYMKSQNYADDDDSYKLKLNTSIIPYHIGHQIGEGAIAELKPEKKTEGGENPKKVLTVSYGSTTQTNKLGFWVEQSNVSAATLAGEHQDTLTFEVKIETTA